MATNDGGFVYKEGVRINAKPAAAVTSTTYYIGSVMVYSSSETVAVSTTVDDTAIAILVGGRQPYNTDDYCAAADKLLELAVDGIVWVRSEDAQSWTFMAPVYNAQTAGTAGTVQTANTNSATKIGYYICDYTGAVGKDRTTTAAGELIGVKLDLYGEAT
jgi:hypothetical protein